MADLSPKLLPVLMILCVAVPTFRLEPITFARDVAPILYANCVVCHRPGGAGPFSLLTYEDARPKADLIAAVTARRFMPPWLPERGLVRYEGERGLTEDEIEVLRRWAVDGAPEGAPADLPTPPAFTEEWVLGPPDLVLELPGYDAPPSGPEIYRNLVAPVHINERRFVRALEVLPGGPVVHHARMMIDTTSSSRRADSLAAGPGFDGMKTASGAVNPDGFFVGWTPGHMATEARPGVAWPLDPETDVVLQLHIRPNGTRQILKPRIGFYFAPEPPKDRPVLIMLGSHTLDIPRGDSAYQVMDTYELPVDVEVLGVYPHAHYLGRRLEGYAKLPNGRIRWLVRIPSWDFNWQDEYVFSEPILLRKGSVLSMRYVYDNSPSNPRNPNRPPKRVRSGPNSTDEMADLVIQLLAENDTDRAILEADQSWRWHKMEMEGRAYAERVLADSLLETGDTRGALSHYRESLLYLAENPQVLGPMAHILLTQGDAESARIVAERAVDLTGRRDPRVLVTLAEAYAKQGAAERALDAARDAKKRAEAMGDRELAGRIEELIARLEQDR